MPLSVRCKSKSQVQNAPFWPQALPCQGFLPLGNQQPGLLPAQQTQSSPCSTPIIVQAPAPAAPIVIQSPPMFIPAWPAQSSDCAQNTPARAEQGSNGRRQQTQGGNMPVLSSTRQEVPDNANQSDDFGRSTSAPAARQRRSSTNSNLNANSNAAAPPIIINIHNSQDTDSNNRSLFAPNVHDESSRDTRLNIASRTRGRSSSPVRTNSTEDSGISPVPVVKTPIPETSPGASLEPVGTSNAQNSEIPLPLTTTTGSQTSQEEPSEAKPGETSPRFMLVRHGRLVHVRPVKASVIEESTSITQAQTPARSVARQSKTMYHYVGWS